MRNTLTILLICNCLFVKGDSWTQKASFPVPGREVPGCFAIGSKGYVGCGNGDSGLLKDFWRYDPATNKWTQKATFAGPATCGVASFAINNKGYFANGYPGTNVVWEYDPATDSWSQKANCGSVLREFSTGFAIGNKGYICCGNVSNLLLNDLWEYDQPTNIWTQKTSLPGGARSHGVSFAINTKGYVTTGEGNTGHLNDLWEYDPSSDTWAQKADLPAVGRVDAAGFSICNKGYVGTGGYPVLSDFWEYDPSSNQWTRKADLPLPARDDCPGFSIGTKGYLGLGDAGNYLTDFWEYTPDSIVCTSSVSPIAGFQSTDTVLCANNCVALSNSSSDATSYQWFFPGANPSSSTDVNPQKVCYDSAGIYNITLVASGPGGSDSVTFTDYIRVMAAPKTPVIRQLGTILYCSTDSSYTSYQWFDSATLIRGATDTSLVISHSGNYNVQVTNEHGCKIAVGITVIIGLEQYLNNNLMTLSPNPAANYLAIRISSLHTNEGVTFSVLNVLGQATSPPTPLQMERGVASIDVSGLPSGMYFSSNEIGEWKSCEEVCERIRFHFLQSICKAVVNNLK